MPSKGMRRGRAAVGWHQEEKDDGEEEASDAIPNMY